MNIAEFIQASSANYTKGRGGNAIDGVAYHYTATSASAHNNLVYFSRPGANASAHLFVDKDGTIRQSVRFEDTAWAVGNFAQNQRTISVEVVSAGEDFTEAQIQACAAIWSWAVKTYGVTRCIRHYDVTGKHCPAPYVNEAKWAALKKRIMGGAPASKPAEAPAGSYTVKVTADALNIRKGAGTNYGIAGCIKDKGVYTIVAEASGQGASKWGKLKSGAGWISLDFVKKTSAGTSSNPKKTNAQIAKEIYNGTCSDSRWSNWGTGQTRKERLAAAGYDYNAVQAEVNKLF